MTTTELQAEAEKLAVFAYQTTARRMLADLIIELAKRAAEEGVGEGK